MKKVSISLMFLSYLIQILVPIYAHAGWVWDWTVGWVYDDKAKVFINPITTGVRDAGHFLGYNYPPRFAYDPKQRSISDKLFAENVKFDIRKNKDYTLIFETQYANEIIKKYIKTGAINYTQLQNHMNNVHREYQKQEAKAAGQINNNPFKGTPQEAARTFFNAVKNVGSITPEIAGPTGIVADYFLKGNSLIYDQIIGPHDQSIAQIGLFNKTQEFEKMADETIQTMRELALYDQSYSNFLKVMTQGRINAPITGDTDAIFNATGNTAFTQDYTISALRPYIRHDGVHISKEQMDELLKAINKQVANQINVASLIINDHNLQCGPEKVNITIDSIQARETARIEHENYMMDAQRSADIARNTLGGCNAGINILAFGIQDRDPGAAIRVTEFGRATIAISSSIIDFSANLANPNLQSGLQQVFSGTIMTGNIVGAVAGLVGTLFGGPNAHEQVMKGIGETKQMIKEFSNGFSKFTEQLDKKLDKITEHTDGRFDVIDTNLGTLITAASSQLNMLNVLIQQSRLYQTEVLNIQQRLLDIQLELKSTQVRVYDEFSRLTSSVIAQVDGLANYLTASHLNYCFDFSKMFPDKYFPDRDYARCLSLIRAFATHRVHDAVIPPDTSLDKDTVVRTLTNFKPDQSVSYILNILRNLYNLPIRDYEVGNPTKWAVATESLIFMLSNYPDNAAQLERKYLFGTETHKGVLDTFKDHGQNVANIMGSIKSTYDTRTLRWTPNTALFKGLIDSYKNALKDLKAQIDEIKPSIIAENYCGFDIYGSLNQTLDSGFKGKDIFLAKKLTVLDEYITKTVDPDLSWFGRMKPILQNLFRMQDDARLMYEYHGCGCRGEPGRGFWFNAILDVLFCKTTAREDGGRDYPIPREDHYPRSSLGQNWNIEFKARIYREDAYCFHGEGTNSEFLAEAWNMIGDACAADVRSDSDIFLRRKAFYINGLKESHKRFLADLREKLTKEDQYNRLNANVKNLDYHHKILTTVIFSALPESIIADDQLRALTTAIYSGTQIKDAIFNGSEEYIIGKGLSKSTLRDLKSFDERRQEHQGSYSEQCDQENKIRSDWERDETEDRAMTERDYNDHYPRNRIQKSLFKPMAETNQFYFNYLPSKLQERINTVLNHNPKPETDPLIRNTLTSLEIYINSH